MGINRNVMMPTLTCPEHALMVFDRSPTAPSARGRRSSLPSRVTPCPLGPLDRADHDRLDAEVRGAWTEANRAWRPAAGGEEDVVDPDVSVHPGVMHLSFNTSPTNTIFGKRDIFF